MSSAITLIVLVVLLVVFFLFTSRARRRQADAATAQAEAIAVGSEVMTTSGLYGTVAAVNDDESVQLQIAAGVEVRWALAALREVDTLPAQYRGGASDEPASS